jgi:putative acetyltransferase
VLIESRPVTDPELATLLIAQQQEISVGDIAYLVVVVQGRVVACGGWQALEPGVAEIKRMYVRPAFRGRGIARQLMVALEEEALAADRPVLRLETGTCPPAAVALFRSAGYAQIPAYGEYAGNPFSMCFEKSLVLAFAEAEF